jgi:hypothetical protein
MARLLAWCDANGVNYRMMSGLDELRRHLNDHTGLDVASNDDLEGGAARFLKALGA